MSLSRIKDGFWGDICKQLYFYIESCDKIEIHFHKGKTIGSDTQKGSLLGEQWFQKHAFFCFVWGFFFTFELKKTFSSYEMTVYEYAWCYYVMHKYYAKITLI